jgi:two-component system, OmpR family, sensor kinase
VSRGSSTPSGSADTCCARTEVSLRLRLAIWYGALTAAIVLLSGLSTYALHSRAHYEDLDQTLVSAAQHADSEGAATASIAEVEQVLAVPTSPEVSTRLYSAELILSQSPNAADAPALSPLQVMRSPSGPAYSAFVGLAPVFVSVNAGHGAFAIAQDKAGQRWRIYVLPLGSTGRFVEVASGLGPIDMSVDSLAGLLIFLGIVGCGSAFAAAWLLAGRALAPVRALTATAGAIARSRSFSQRVPLTPTEDELDRLALTFNQMLQSLEIAYKGQQRFVSDASHELRAPLTAIQANLELLETHPNMSEPDRRVAINEAGREATRLTRLVAELLALARADAGVVLTSRPVDLDEIALAAVQEARHIAQGRRIEIEKLDPIKMTGDPDRLKELLLILLDNAVKYSPDHGLITLRMLRDGACAQVAVNDHGIGIKPDDLPHVFERFYRADPARSADPGGSGLGLAIARWIAERHGGRIAIDSQPGEGTHATISLPIAS